MGYKILDVKADIHEDIEKYFQHPCRERHATNLVPVSVEEILDSVDKHFEKIER